MWNTRYAPENDDPKALGLAVGPQTLLPQVEGFRTASERPPAGDPVRQRLTDSGMLPLCAVSSK